MIDNPAVAYASGWKVRRPTDPATVPVRYPDQRWWLLDDQGRRALAEHQQGD